MQITRNRKQCCGSALIVTLLTAVIIGISLASYLTLVSSQNLSVMRATAWNSCMPVLEAGLEEALTQINQNGITGLSANQWTLGTDGLFHKTRDLGTDGSFYHVTIQPVDPPVIVSVGYVPAPLTSRFQSGMILGVITGEPTSADTQGCVSRRVRVNTARAKTMFSKAMLAKSAITFSGSAKTDSFNSCDGPYDPATARDNGDVGSNGTVDKVFTGSSTVKIYGKLSTGPGGGYSLSGSAAIGSKAWHDAGATGVQPGYYADDMNVEFPDVTAPFAFGTGFTPKSDTIGGTNYTYVIGDGNWNLTDFVLSGTKALVTGDAVLYVSTRFAMSSSSAQIIIAPGASLKLYVAAKDASISGGGVANLSAKAENFMYYGLPTNTKIAFSSTSSFCGVIYAPSALLAMSGGSSSSLIDFTGSSVTSTVTMSGGRAFHYDECLAGLGGGGDFVVAAWNEF